MYASLLLNYTRIVHKGFLWCSFLSQSADIFLKNNIDIRVSNGLDPNQDIWSIGPDLGPNCLKSYEQMTDVECGTIDELVFSITTRQRWTLVPQTNLTFSLTLTTYKS